MAFSHGFKRVLIPCGAQRRDLEFSFALGLDFALQSISGKGLAGLIARQLCGFSNTLAKQVPQGRR